MQVSKFSRTASIVLLAVTAAAISGCGHSQAATAPAAAPATEVTVAQVIARPLHPWVEVTGALQAVDTVQVRARVSGFVDAIRFVEGAHVAKGTVLFQIDPRPFAYEVERLQAELARAQSKLDLTKADRTRAERLIAQNAISREEYEQNVDAATEAAADLESIRAQLQTARLNLTFTQVISPIDGRVSRALITAGNLVSSADVLTTVVSDDPVYAYFDSDEATYLKFAGLTRGAGHTRNEPASTVYMGLVGEQGYPHEGHLDFVDNQVDSHSGTIRARAVFDNHDGRFTPGLFARIKLVAHDSHDTVLIEDRAVGTDLGKKYVLVLRPDSSLEYRMVELGRDIDGLRVVESGLAPSDVVVVNGLQHVAPGAHVVAQRVDMDANRPGLQQVADAPVAPVTPAAAHSGPVLAASTRADHANR